MREFNTRTTKGNYSITFETDDRKAFEQVQTLCRILIDGKDGDVIPIEWIKKKYIGADDVGMGIDDWSAKDCYRYVLEQWEKENE